MILRMNSLKYLICRVSSLNGDLVSFGCEYSISNNGYDFINKTNWPAYVYSTEKVEEVEIIVFSVFSCDCRFGTFRILTFTCHLSRSAAVPVLQAMPCVSASISKISTSPPCC